ncbi:nucleotidyltransferase domain-containing protein [Candidatus Saccharibacteria bacterium]|nr:nucleotidyltransferase domain-containing protein [Candidatus Saccharibacteria bacterium]
MENRIIEALAPFGPYSVFLYGSRGRGDHREDSDYEVGVIFEDEKLVRRSLLHEKIRLDAVRIYPFKLSDVLAGEFNNPFVSQIFARELVEGAGKTIYGKQVVEALKLPKITTLDLMQCIRFEVGSAFTALLAYRRGELKVSGREVGKSCFYGLLLYIILKQRKFVFSPEAAYEIGRGLELEERYAKAIKNAHAVYMGSQELRVDVAFENLAFLGFVEAEILREFELRGIAELV